jgi:excisionase family DNA binding protein
MPQDQYQTVREVADRLKVAEAMVRHWIRERELRAIDIGKGWRIADADLEDFLLAHQTAPKRDTGPTAQAGAFAAATDRVPDGRRRQRGAVT